jgi:hypothetical protein
MLFRDFWKYLHAAIPTESPEEQEEAINALFQFLNQSAACIVLPSLLYELALDLFEWYLKHLLPTLDYYDTGDRQAIIDEYAASTTLLKETVERSRIFEEAMRQLLHQIQQHVLTRPQHVANALEPLLREKFSLDVSPRSLDGEPFQGLLRHLQRHFHYDHAAAFFDRLFPALLEPSQPAAPRSHRRSAADFTNVFAWILARHFEAHVVLVDTLLQGHIMPLHVVVECGCTSEHVEFQNQQIDAAMQLSADIARTVAQRYLREYHSRHIPEDVAVHCLFPRYGVSFRDNSAGLLLGIRIVGDVASKAVREL